MSPSWRLTPLALVLLGPLAGRAAEPALPGQFRWTTGAPVLLPGDVPGDRCLSVKDPSIVRHGDRWHLFCTVRCEKRSHAIQHLSFADWKDAGKAKRHALPVHSGYFCAPQVFFFTPQKKWYLICQAAGASWEPRYQPAYSTTDDITDPASWAPLRPLGATKPAAARAWLDFWVICDGEKAHLFFTSLDGKMWRAETALARFPAGWSEPVLALRGDVFEASHTYLLSGSQKYLTLIEAQGGHGWRYFKAYVADRLDGAWRPLAAGRDHAFASMRNVEQTAGRWTDAVSHGELLREGFDERLEVRPDRLRFVFQGVSDRERAGKKYGEIPWKLGILEPAR